MPPYQAKKTMLILKVHYFSSDVCLLRAVPPAANQKYEVASERKTVIHVTGVIPGVISCSYLTSRWELDRRRSSWYNSRTWLASDCIPTISSVKEYSMFNLLKMRFTKTTEGPLSLPRLSLKASVMPPNLNTFSDWRRTCSPRGPLRNSGKQSSLFPMGQSLSSYWPVYRR